MRRRLVSLLLICSLILSNFLVLTVNATESETDYESNTDIVVEEIEVSETEYESAIPPENEIGRESSEIDYTEYTSVENNTVENETKSVITTDELFIIDTYNIEGNVLSSSPVSNWVSNFEIEIKNSATSTDIRSLVAFDQETTEYTVDIASGGVLGVYLTPASEAATGDIYYQFLLDSAVREGDAYKPKQIGSTERIDVTSAALSTQELAWTGKTLTLLVGPLTEGEDNLNAENCNVYSFIIRKVPGFTSLEIKNEDATETYTLDPEFHRQDTVYAVETDQDTIKIGIGLSGATVTLPKGEANTGTKTKAWYTVTLADYTEADSNVAVIPMTVTYTKSGESYSRVITLQVTKIEKAHNWVSNFEIEIKNSATSTDIRSLVAFDQETTEYTVDIASGGVLGVYLTPASEAATGDIYYQFLLDSAVREGDAYKPKQIGSTERIDVTSAALSTQELAWTGKTLTLLVGPLTEGEDNLNAENCNVYSFIIRKVPGFTSLEIKNEDATETYTLDPEFHRQDTVYAVETDQDTIKIGIGLSGATVTLPKGEANTGTKTKAWYTVTLADYTEADSNVAVIPMTVTYTKSGESYSRVITLQVTKIEKAHNWVSNFEIETKNNASSEGVYSLVKFDPAVTEYAFDYANGTYMEMYLTPAAEAVGQDIYYQFLVDGKVREGDNYAPQKIESADRINVNAAAIAYTNVAWGGQKLTLLVGPLASGAVNLSEADCNVYQFTINMMPSLNTLKVREAATGGAEYTLNPVFHRQENTYELTAETTELKVVMQYVGGTTVTIPDATKSSPKLTSNTITIDLTKYMTEGSNVAEVPVQLSFTSGGTEYKRTITLKITLKEEAHNWVSNFEIETKNSASSEGVYSLVRFDPAVTEYSVDFGIDSLIGMYLTPTSEAVAENIYYQFLLNGTVREGDSYKPQKIESTERIDVSSSAISAQELTWTEQTLTLMVGTLAEGDDNLKAENCNVYNFKVKWTPTLLSLTLSNALGEKSYTLDPVFNGQNNEYSAEVSSTYITLRAECTKGITLSLPNRESVLGTETQPYVDIDLNKYLAENTNTATVPVKIKYNSSGIDYERTITLSFTLSSFVPVITDYSEDVVCNKGDSKDIYVQVAPITGDGELSYQWYVERGQTRPDRFGEYNKIEGATASVYSPPTTEAMSYMWYGCKVTYKNTDGETYTTLSNYIHFQVNLNYVNKPVITHQPGTCILGGFNNTVILENAFKTEYYEGESCDPIFVGMEVAEQGVTRSVSWYYNATDSNSNGILIPSNFYRGTSGCYGYRLNYTFEAGTYYVYCVIRYTDQTNSDNYAETVSETCKIVFKSLNSDDFEGEGTETNPYLLKTQEDLLRLHARVNDEGIPYAGAYFKIANDIELPSNWTPIGCTKDGAYDIQNGLNLNAFSGTIDGKISNTENATLTVPSGGMPLLGYVNGATVLNLNIKGESIEGAGLVNNYTGPGLSGNAVTIENVCLLSGTKTLKSGLVNAVYGGNSWACASTGFVVTIRNCVVQPGVVIGYTGTESQIGSFANRINGTIENCTSSATVKGRDYVGGILGTMDNAMGKCAVKNSQFHGAVEASGSYAGGIVGGGYSNDNSAPNGGRPSIMACTVDGTVKGIECVGGITGGDRYVAQTRDNATQSVTGNTFTGTLSGNKYVGGIIGYYNSLNKYDNIAGNTYSGAETGIGYVKYIDTSYENPALMDGTIAFNTGNTIEGLPEIEWNTWKAGLNRADDPLGKDAESLCKKIGSSQQPICYELTASGTYKTEYTVGDELDLSGIKLTAHWNNGTTSEVELKDITIEGYNKNKEGQQTVTLSYGAAKLEIVVSVKPKSTKITVTVTVLGDSKHGDTTSPHGLARGGLKEWYKGTLEADTAETVWDVLQRTGLSFNADSSNQYGTVYIRAVNGLGEFDNGKNSGWMYTVNGSHPEVGVSARYLKDGDNIVLHYTDDYTYEEGGDNYGKPAQNAAYVIDLIDKIGTVTFTDACKAKIDAARKAYDALSAEEKGKVTNYKKLTDAEDQYKKMKEADDKAKAKAVDDLISKIGTVTINSGTAINAAWNGYNKLTTEQKELVTKLSTLQEATRKWNQLKADEVIKLIDKIEDPVTEKSSASIGAARKAYDALTKDQKNLVTNVKKLTDAETAYAKLTASEEDKKKAQEVIDLIDKLKNVTPDSEQDIKDARKAYDALTDLQKKLVDNYNVLTAAETKLAMLKTMGKVSDPYITTGDYMEALGTPSVGAIGGEWMVIGLARSDRNVPGVEDYYKNVLEYVAKNIDPETGRLHKAKSTDNSRIILALTAIGRDVTNVGGYDLLQGLSDLEFVKYQGSNGPIWALLALDSGNYPVPTGGTVTRQALIDEILRVQTADGGWTVSGDKADSDMTGMALTALAPYYTKDLKVQEAIDKAIARLSEMQDEDGGYSTSYDGTTKVATSESISQVVTALSALGINADTDPRFVKDGNSAIDALLRYYVSGGGFKHVMDGELDGMATEQAYYALTAYYRFLTGKTSLYDMTDTINKGGDPVEVPTEPTVPATTEPAEVEPAKTSFPWWILVICVAGGCGLGVVIAIVIVPKLKKKN